MDANSVTCNETLINLLSRYFPADLYEYFGLIIIFYANEPA
ncbi:hypothetical protein CCP3SC1_320036 [Gammaproteobacteria bacterium]